MTFNASQIPTKVDVDAATGRGSPRPGGIRSHTMKLDFTESANRIIGQVNGLTKAVQTVQPDYDHDGMTAIRFHVIGAALNDILTRAFELDDPVLKASLNQLGLLDNNGSARPIRFDPTDKRPLGPTDAALTPIVPTEHKRCAIAAAVREGVHHSADNDWLLEATLETLANEEAMRLIGDAIAVGATSGTSPFWRLWIRAE